MGAARPRAYKIEQEEHEDEIAVGSWRRAFDRSFAPGAAEHRRDVELGNIPLVPQPGRDAEGDFLSFAQRAPAGRVGVGGGCRSRRRECKK